MLSGSFPITKGLRYCSMAATTAWGRWVNVAQPTPYRPGSLVITLTTTSRIRLGAVQITLTSVIVRLDICFPLFLDRRIRSVAPLGPRAIVHPHVLVTDQPQRQRRVGRPH